MVSLKNYKLVVYIILACVVILSFALTNLLLGLIISGSIGSYAILYIIFNLLLNFTMFFFIFRFAQQLIEKESALREILNQLQTKNEIAENTIETKEEKKFDLDEILQQIIPASPQNLTIELFTEKILANIAKVSGLVQGVFYIKDKSTGQFNVKGKYAYYSNNLPQPFFEGETLTGQVAKDKKIIQINNIPEEYFVVVSGLGKSSPGNLLIIPVIEKDETIAVIELATFMAYDEEFEKLFEKLSVLLGKIIIKIK
jgi:hypothetical protein